MQIAFIGDIVGRPGRKIIKKHLKNIKTKYNIDFVIANIENASGGFGITKKNLLELFSYGIDFATSGNHIWDKDEVYGIFKENLPLIRPLNYPKGVAGDGYKIVKLDEDLVIVNLMGLTSMPQVDNPFNEILDFLETNNIKNVIIDFHAEATAEKNTLFHLVKNNVTAILGTHTHISTDDMIIDNGCFYITDVGLSGCIDGVIGMDKTSPIKKALTGIKHSYKINNNCKAILQLIVLDINNGKTKDAFKIKIFNDKEYISYPLYL